jgi:hypothetical protein
MTDHEESEARKGRKEGTKERRLMKLEREKKKEQDSRHPTDGKLGMWSDDKRRRHASV